MEKKSLITLIMLGTKGCCGVGKTSLCNVFLGVKFNSNTLSTVGVVDLYSEMTMSEAHQVKIRLLDTAGHERFNSISISHIRRSNGVIVVFDITDKKSFKDVYYWLEEIRNESKDIPVVLFGNKCDLEERREVTKKEAQKYADEHRVLYFETSAKNNIGFKEGFETICEKIYRRMELKGFRIGDKKIKNKQGVNRNIRREAENKCCIY